MQQDDTNLNKASTGEPTETLDQIGSIETEQAAKAIPAFDEVWQSLSEADKKQALAYCDKALKP